MNNEQKHSIGLNSLPFYMRRILILSAVFASIFLFFIYQQWWFINNNEKLLSQYHLPSISKAYQLQNELSNLQARIPKDISSLYMAQMMSEYNVSMNSQTLFSYTRKIISDLLLRINQLQKGHEETFFTPSIKRLQLAVDNLLETLKQNETALRIEAAAINFDLNQARVIVEQLRRLHERSAKNIAIVIEDAYQNLIWSATILGISLFIMWTALFFRSSAIIRFAVVKQQKSEKKITESQKLLEDILNHTSACIYLKDLEGKYLLRFNS